MRGIHRGADPLPPRSPHRTAGEGCLTPDTLKRIDLRASDG